MTVTPENEATLPLLPTVKLCHVAFHAISEQECISHIFECLERGQGGWVVTVNLDHLRRLRARGDYGCLCRDATLIMADGMPVIWASRIQGTPLPERVAGSDLISSLSAAAARHGRSVYLLGGEPGTAERAADILREGSANLRVAGTFCPPVGFESDLEQMDRIERRLRGAQPDIVYVALGSPKQERLISRLRNRLPKTWWMGVGISFSFLCGDVRRAPQWMQRLGLEWVHRLIQEPRRLANRYLLHGIPFAGSLLAGAALRRIANVRQKAI